MSDAPSAPLPPVGPDPASQVAGPALGLMITAGLGIAGNAVGLLINLFGAGMGAASGDAAEGFGAMLSGGLGMVFNVVGIAVGVLVIMGALKMKQLESYGLALAASIVAIVPCILPCCILGLPIGIWAVVVLNKPEVKSAFH